MLADAPIHAYVPAIDIERCRRFYVDTLGLDIVGATGPGYTFRCGAGTTFFMYPTPNAGTNQASCAFWQVDDVEAVVKWLQARGVAFERYAMPGDSGGNLIHVGGGAKAAWFKDSEGNIMALVEAMADG